ncbi:lysophospholipid transporter LplT [Massilia sp. TWR1-2-2]|uniref:lysophospholipid transporter LplT n=1 Tax=Massilia sp. TWR1-2-2 TaxID=2804584 RepID=UPI003CF414CA
MTRATALRAVLASQFFTSLGDNALLIVAIGLLLERAAPAWMTPALRICLYLAYVLLAPLAGALADAFPKGRVMLLTNVVKLGACVLLAAGVHPLLAFGAIGIIGVMYGPAKYAVLAELVPAGQLIAANAWIEISTVASIIGGTVLGGLLLAPGYVLTGMRSPAHSATLVIVGLYALSALCAAAIPALASADNGDARSVRAKAASFGHAFSLLWADPQGRIALAVTTLFWAIAALLQFLVIEWAGTVLGMTLSQSALMQCFLAAGIVAGAVAVARLVPSGRATAALPAGLALGAAILAMTLVRERLVACTVLVLAGIVAAIVLVPMNALFQQRGEALMAPGLSIAVQSFNENLASLVFLAAYGALLALAVPVRMILAGCGLLTIVLMLAIIRWHRAGTCAPAGGRT